MASFIYALYVIEISTFLTKNKYRTIKERYNTAKKRKFFLIYKLFLLLLFFKTKWSRLKAAPFQKSTKFVGNYKRSNSTVKWRISSASFTIFTPRVILSRRSYTFFNAAAITSM